MHVECVVRRRSELRGLPPGPMVTASAADAGTHPRRWSHFIASPSGAAQESDELPNKPEPAGFFWAKPTDGGAAIVLGRCERSSALWADVQNLPHAVYNAHRFNVGA